MLWNETQADPVLRQKAFEGLSRYQSAPRVQKDNTMQVIAVQDKSRLLRYCADTSSTRTPVVFIPSLINPPFILDLAGDQSLLQYLSALGHDPYLVDWGHPQASDAALDLGGHIRERLLPLLAALDQPPVLIGYCLGGTLAIAAAMLHPVSALAVIASPWKFDGFPDDTRQQIDQLWMQAKPMCEQLGYVPMEVLQSGFWALSPTRTVQKYADFADMPEGSAQAQAFIALEDWANDGAPLTYAAGCELFESLYAGNATGLGKWSINDRIIDPTTLPCPSLSIASTTDRIVPDAASPPTQESWQLDMGHVGMIVGSRARAQLWEPLAQWLSKHGA